MGKIPGLRPLVVAAETHWYSNISLRDLCDVRDFTPVVFGTTLLWCRSNWWSGCRQMGSVFVAADSYAIACLQVTRWVCGIGRMLLMKGLTLGTLGHIFLLLLKLVLEASLCDCSFGRTELVLWCPAFNWWENDDYKTKSQALIRISDTFLMCVKSDSHSITPTSLLKAGSFELTRKLDVLIPSFILRRSVYREYTNG